jgi:hypothetical protein
VILWATSCANCALLEEEKLRIIYEYGQEGLPAEDNKIKESRNLH